MRRVVTPARLLTLGLVLFCTAVVLYIFPSNEYIFLPDPPHPVAPLITVAGGHDPQHGGVYFVDVVIRKATLLERIFGGLHDGAQLVPADEVNPPGTNDAQRRQIDLSDMRNSQQIAAAVALRADGKKVVLRQVGARVDGVVAGEPAAGKIEPADVITNVGGAAVRNPADVFNVMSHKRPGQVVRFTVRRDKQTLSFPLRTIASTSKPVRPVVGVFLEQALDIRLPIKVRIDAGNVGGPSAGLAFALGLLEELGRNVVHGHKVAATGELFPDGSVGPIGGITQKTVGARESGVDTFLVPAGENARDAKKVAHGLRIIPVETFPQALRALATLPPVA